MDVARTKLALASVYALAACGRLGFENGANRQDATGGPSDAIDGADVLVASCVGHDEDGDAFPDACDVCPTIADPSQADLGELQAGAAPDGVGDACDPRPSLAGDYIQLIDMHTDASSTTYLALRGVNQYVSDALRLGSTTLDGQAAYRLTATATRLEIHARIVDVSAPSVDKWFGIWYDEDMAGTRDVFAQAEQSSSNPNAFFQIREVDGSDRNSLRMYGTSPFAVGQQYTFVVETGLVTANGDDTLTVTDHNGATFQTGEPILIPRDLDGFLEANAMVVDFDHFIVYAMQ